MPQNIVDGNEAKQVARFVAKYAGQAHGIAATRRAVALTAAAKSGGTRLGTS